MESKIPLWFAANTHNGLVLEVVVYPSEPNKIPNKLQQSCLCITLSVKKGQS
jgi:hypothetical protein